MVTRTTPIYGKIIKGHHIRIKHLSITDSIILNTILSTNSPSLESISQRLHINKSYIEEVLSVLEANNLLTITNDSIILSLENKYNLDFLLRTSPFILLHKKLEQSLLNPIPNTETPPQNTVNIPNTP